MIVGVVDYGMGNLRSVQSALELFKAEVRITDDAALLAGCDGLILPGVGSFFRAMQHIEERGLREVLHGLVDDGLPLLGICLGMQLLAREGSEDGVAAGLGFIDARVERLDVVDRPVPHVGFNATRFTEQGRALCGGLGASADFYFVHSYRMVCSDDDDVAGWCDYGGEFAAVVKRGNVMGVQFHPEKSQSNGLKLIQSFLQLAAAC